jgi:hydroxymethylbilane synthase
LKTIRIGTRGSDLALWQANQTKHLLEKQGIEVQIIIIKTKGDKIQHLSFDKIEGKGFFTKEIEDALLKDEIDLAVHSMKDLPTTMDERLGIAGVSERVDPADWLIIRGDSVALDSNIKLPPQAIVGTSSARRKCQLRSIRPDLQLKDIRGNVPTRLNKLREGAFDGIMLAAAGLTRLQLDLSDFEIIKFHPREFVPAPAQGVLAYQTRKNDENTREMVSAIHHRQVAQLTNIERRILRLFDGGCHLPLGAYCEKDAMDNYHVWAAFAPTVDHELRRTKLSYSTTQELAEDVHANLTA